MAAAENAFSLAVVSHTSKPLVCAAAAAAAQDHQDLRRTITNIIHGKALQWELSPDTFRNVAQKLYPDAGRLLAKLKDKDRQKNLLSDAEQLLHAAGVSNDGEVGRFVKGRGNLKHLTAFCMAGLHQLPLMTVMTMTEGDLCRRSVYQQLAYTLCHTEGVEGMRWTVHKMLGPAVRVGDFKAAARMFTCGWHRRHHNSSSSYMLNCTTCCLQLLMA
jgi:hypothetical protein